MMLLKRMIRVLLNIILFIAGCFLYIVVCSAGRYTLGVYRLFHESDVQRSVMRGTACEIILLFLFFICISVFIMRFSRHYEAEIAVSVSKMTFRTGPGTIWYCVCCPVLLITFLISGYRLCNTYDRQHKVYDMRQFLCDERFVIHAGGFVDGTAYTNSREAIENCYAGGNMICEIDILQTGDGQLVLGHDGGDGAWASGIDTAERLSLEEYAQKRVFGKYTTMSFDDLAEFMRGHPGFCIVTDVKDDNIECCRMIAGLYPDLKERIIVQIYHEGEYREVSDMGFPFIIYTLYRTDDDEHDSDVLKKTAIQDDLTGFTFWADWAEGDFLQEMLRTDTPLLVHSVEDDVNTEDTIKMYFEKGIAGVYTDRTDFGKREKEI